MIELTSANSYPFVSVLRATSAAIWCGQPEPFMPVNSMMELLAPTV